MGQFTPNTTTPVNTPALTDPSGTLLVPTDAGLATGTRSSTLALLDACQMVITISPAAAVLLGNLLDSAFKLQPKGAQNG